MSKNLGTMVSPSKADLEALRNAGESRDGIALYYGVSLSRVKRWIKLHDIKPSAEPHKAHISARNKAERRRAEGVEDGLTVIEKARVILGKRLSEDYRGYLLDGRPVRIDALARAAGLIIPESP